MKKAIILLSGGQDSTTCLAWALNKFDEVEALTIDYGQKHKVEIECAKKITQIKNVPHHIIETNDFKNLTDNALTNHNQAITAGSETELPSTFVPGRNLIFLVLTAIYASKLEIEDIVIGVCQTDYSGYPDCRENFINSATQTINLALEKEIKIHTPLMHLTKAETVKMIEELGELELLKYSHTCYNGERPACGHCPACKLRLKGFKEAKIQDPLPYQND